MVQLWGKRRMYIECNENKKERKVLKLKKYIIYGIISISIFLMFYFLGFYGLVDIVDYSLSSFKHKAFLNYESSILITITIILFLISCLTLFLIIWIINKIKWGKK